MLLVELAEQSEVDVVEQQLRVLVVHCFEGFGAFADDHIDQLPQVFGAKVAQSLLEAHFLVVGHFLFVLLLLVEVVAGGRTAVLRAARSWHSCMMWVLLPGTVMGMLGR